jgi:uncharacterized protein (DUF433 family)
MISYSERVVVMVFSVISRDPQLLGGLAVFRSTRVPVKTLLDYLSTGETVDVFLDDFPTVKYEQVIQFLHEVGMMVADENIVG